MVVETCDLQHSAWAAECACSAGLQVLGADFFGQSNTQSSGSHFFPLWSVHAAECCGLSPAAGMPQLLCVMHDNSGRSKLLRKTSTL